MRLFLLLLATLLASCVPHNEPPSKQVIVVCTTQMIADGIAASVPDSIFRVATLMNAATDPHLYKPSLRDVEVLQQADVIIANGLHLEGKLATVLQSLSRDRIVLELGDGVARDSLLKLPGGEDAYDPHVWFDPLLWGEAMAHTARQLAGYFPDHSEQLIAGGTAYQASLSQLHEELVQEISALSPEKRKLVTAHDAFGYYARRYGFEVRSLQGLSTTAEFGVADVQEVVNYLVKERVPAMFAESSLPERTLRAVHQACAARGHYLNRSGTLYSDAMGAPGTSEETLAGALRHNTQTILSALHDTRP